jgi:hypothetical protein
MCHRTVRCASGVTANSPNGRLWQELQWAIVPRRSQSSEVRGAPDCPMPQEDKVPTVARALNPNSWVTWRRIGHWTVSVRWRTGLFGGAPDCPVRPSTAASPTATLVVGGYKYPQPPQLQASKFSEHHIQYKSSSIHYKTQYKRSNSLRVPNPLQTLSGLWERFLCSFEFLSLGLAFFFSYSYSQVLCKRGKSVGSRTPARGGE